MLVRYYAYSSICTSIHEGKSISHSPYEIILATPQNFPKLLQIWSDSVLATHDFLAQDYYEKLYSQMQEIYLPAIQEIWLIVKEEEIVGFMGFNPPTIEMLFITPSNFKQGLGKTLLNFVKAKNTTLLIDVNEQNVRALKMYQSQGFNTVSRSSVDSAGMPYPVLHLKWSNDKS